MATNITPKYHINSLTMLAKLTSAVGETNGGQLRALLNTIVLRRTEGFRRAINLSPMMPRASSLSYS